MNKTVITTGIVLLVIFASCEREPDERDDVIDERDDVIGTYSGISVETSRVDYDYHHDTTDIKMFLTKSKKDSIVNVDIVPPISREEFKFKYHDGEFTSLMEYHPPRLTMKIDSLYLNYQPGLAPHWTSCFTRKVK
jgi:hypothetical protein